MQLPSLHASIVYFLSEKEMAVLAAALSPSAFRMTKRVPQFLMMVLLSSMPLSRRSCQN
jgi:hypothetical protein